MPRKRSKQCGKCQEKKTVDNFRPYPLERAKDGLYYKCKECERQERIGRREKTKIYNKQYRLRVKKRKEELAKKAEERRNARRAKRAANKQQ